MRPLAPASILLALAPAAVCLAEDPASPAVRRFALVVGANRGAADRVPLRYAVGDAERFARLVMGIGGVRPTDCILLREPTRQAFLDALAAMRARTSVARSAAARIEVLIYFSGHADELGLMLGRDLMPYRELRVAIGEIAADVGITILDACASGAITRLKGGQAHPAFLTDASTQVQGYAFLTSSSEGEAAQESDRLQGSFFTHALLTGLRGGADVSGDGRVTLGEAYQFAFSETLSQTTATQAGAQHPSYDIKMAGTGELVMTDIRQTSASLILGPQYDGRFLVLDSHRHLIAELRKPYGRNVELGLEPGQYEIYFEQEQTLLASSLRLDEGQRHELARQELRRTRRLPARRRGPGLSRAAKGDLLEGRWRLAGLGAVTNIGVRIASNGVKTGGAAGAGVLSRWVRKDLALDFWTMGVGLGASSTGAEAQTGGDLGFLVGTRYYPRLPGTVRPYLGGALGAFRHVCFLNARTTTEKGIHDTGLGGLLGGGADLMLGRSFNFSLDGRLTLRSGRPSRFDLWFGFGWTFGGRGGRDV